MERFAHLVFLLSGLILPLHGLSGQEEVLRQPVVRLATYNVHGGIEASAAAVARFLAGQNLDLLSLQEVPSQEYLETLASGTGLVHFSLMDRFKAILSRVPLEDTEQIPLVTGRGVIRTTVNLRGIPLSVYAVHNSWDQSGDRENRQLANEILPLDPNPRKILLGDFNDEHYSTQNIVLERVLNDAWTDLGVRPGELTTWPATGFAGSEGHQLIDLLLYDPAGGMYPVSASIPKLAPVLSDHRPVVFNMRLSDPIFVEPPRKFTVDAVFGPQLLELCFDREVDVPSASDPARYTITRSGQEGGTVEVLRARVDRHRRRVRLVTGTQEPGVSYELRVEGVAARQGGVGMPPTTGEYTFLENRVINPGAENGLEGWEPSGGMEAVTGLGQLQPYVGDAFFAGGERDAESRASQQISLEQLGPLIDQGRVQAHLAAYLAAAYLAFPSGESRAEPYDEAEVSFTFLSAEGAELWSSSSGKYDTLYWWPYRETVAVPRGARSARVTIAANRRTLIGGARNDGAVEEVFLGIEIRPTDHGRLGGNLLLNPGAESADLAPWVLEGDFRRGENLARFLTDYLVSRSGDGMFMAYPSREAGDTVMEQAVDLPAGVRYLGWGGRLKSFASIMGIGLEVEALGEDKEVLHSAGTGLLRCAQWESISEVFRVPPGARGARLRVSAGGRGRAAFADDLYLLALGSADGSAWFERGDVDGSGGLNITDAVAILQFLFALPAPGGFCADAADVDDDGRVAVTDAIRLLQHLYRGGPPPEEPRPGRPGPDPTPDGLECE